MKKKKVLITGCTKGIGYAIAKKLLAAGEYTVYGIARATESSDLNKHPNVHLYNCNLEVPHGADIVLRKILDDSSGIDIAISNAGIGNFQPIDQLLLADWNAVINVNLTAAYLVMHHTLPHMKQQNFGKLVIISSDADHFSFAEAGAYCASKAGLSSLADCVRKEVDGYDITVTAISPGRVDTNFNHKKKGDRPDSLCAEDVADQIVPLLTQSGRCEIEKISLNSVLEKELH